MRKPKAHSRKDLPFDEWQSLTKHLEAVAQRAAGFAAAFGTADWAYVAGLWHDLGKFAPDWQEFLERAGTGKRVGRGPVHSSAGAIHAQIQFGNPGRILSYIIAGHHAGLADWLTSEEGNASLQQRLSRRDHLDRALAGEPPDEVLNPPKPVGKPPRTADGRADAAFWIRMLFSCLVDADYLDTEAFAAPVQALLRGGYPSLKELSAKFDSFMCLKMERATDTPINRLRRSILERCLQMADHAPGLFSLTVPTGGGKTLASMGFALRHAIRHRKRRIIYVIPYTSIIEQTADVFREVFGDNVVEHHSNLDGDPEDEAFRKSRLASENWDAPIIVTTNVQFFESLYSAQASRCRKLHNIAGSVVVLDEAQLLPVEFLEPCLHAIRVLNEAYGTTFVLATATQPALAPRESPGFHFKGLQGVVEIMESPERLHDDMRRVTVHVPSDLTATITWPELAARLVEHESILCIVNRRDDCRELHRLMPRGTYHLSGQMCGAHRAEVLEQIRADLSERRLTRVISTQLVEAGVDLDFPVVYRALAGLDSIAQAAGRCNREGRRDTGDVHLFVPPTQAPPGVLRQGVDITRRLLSENGTDVLHPSRFEVYFRNLFWLQGDRLDSRRVLDDLHGTNLEINFRTAARKFRIIDDKAQRPVLVRWGEGVELIATLERCGPEPWLLRKLQRYVVNLPGYLHSRLRESGEILEFASAPGIYVQAADGSYDPELGFACADQMTAYNPDDLIV